MSSRLEIIAGFRQKRKEGKPISGGGAGTGISAKFEEAGGIDLIVMDMAREVLPAVRQTPALTLEQCVPVIEEMVAAAKRVRDDVLILCHGGPIAEPEDAAYILREIPEIDGFYGASSMERLPTERAINEPSFARRCAEELLNNMNISDRRE